MRARLGDAGLARVGVGQQHEGQAVAVVGASVTFFSPSFQSSVQA